MFGIGKKAGASSLGFLGYSGILHGVLVAAIGTVGQLTPMQMGTEATTVQFDVQSLPKGVQTDKLTPHKVAKSPVKVKTKTDQEKPVVVVKKTIPKPVKKLEKKPVKPKKQVAKPVKKAEVKEKVAVKAPAEKEVPKAESAIAKVLPEKEVKPQTEEEKALIQEMARKELEQENIQQEQAAQVEESQIQAEEISDLPQKASQGYGVETARAHFNLKQVFGNVPPKYPELARRQRIQGQGELLYYVTKSGKVTQVRLAKSTGNKSLDDSALSAIGKFRYVSGQEGWTRHPFSFDLTGSATQTPSRLRR
ncbi:TonB family protein [bacterium]|nr:TonB family protein [bacterium]